MYCVKSPREIPRQRLYLYKLFSQEICISLSTSVHNLYIPLCVRTQLWRVRTLIFFRYQCEINCTTISRKFIGLRLSSSPYILHAWAYNMRKCAGSKILGGSLGTKEPCLFLILPATAESTNRQIR